MIQLTKIMFACGISVASATAADKEVVRFEGTSPYHNIRVVDQGEFRMLSFDGTRETRMSLEDSLQGHFEYTEYFHMAWLWNTQMSNVLMIGLGGASVQRSFEHYYPGLRLETVEIDPMVREVAQKFFNLKESKSQRVHTEDGRVFLRRNPASYDLIVADAYTKSRYGSSIPYHLATKEFFEIANSRLSTNGVMAYNVIGTVDGWNSDIIGAMYKTMNSVFPHVYLFPASGSRNVVLIAVKSKTPLNMVQLHQRALDLMQSGRISLPTFQSRFKALRRQTPASVYRSRILTDDYAPVDGLLSRSR